jgi:L-serine deaminase
LTVKNELDKKRTRVWNLMEEVMIGGSEPESVVVANGFKTYYL